MPIACNEPSIFTQIMKYGKDAVHFMAVISIPISKKQCDK
jgi:hypothetical protein